MMSPRQILTALALLAMPMAAGAQSTAAGETPASKPAAAKSAAKPDTKAATTTRGGSVAGEAAGAVAENATAADAARLVIDREVFSYRADGRRDPYESLMTSGELRPLPSDLRLTAVAFDPRGRNSVAVLRNVATAEQYRVRVGQALGRLRIASIRPKAVVFSIDEFGFSRQETLPLSSDSTSTRTR